MGPPRVLQKRGAHWLGLGGDKIGSAARAPNIALLSQSTRAARATNGCLAECSVPLWPLAQPMAQWDCCACGPCRAAHSRSALTEAHGANEWGRATHDNCARTRIWHARNSVHQPGSVSRAGQRRAVQLAAVARLSPQGGAAVVCWPAGWAAYCSLLAACCSP